MRLAEQVLADVVAVVIEAPSPLVPIVDVVATNDRPRHHRRDSVPVIHPPLVGAAIVDGLALMEGEHALHRRVGVPGSSQWERVAERARRAGALALRASRTFGVWSRGWVRRCWRARDRYGQARAGEVVDSNGGRATTDLAGVAAALRRAPGAGHRRVVELVATVALLAVLHAGEGVVRIGAYLRADGERHAHQRRRRGLGTQQPVAVRVVIARWRRLGHAACVHWGSRQQQQQLERKHCDRPWDSPQSHPHLARVGASVKQLLRLPLGTRSRMLARAPRARTRYAQTSSEDPPHRRLRP
eukprot:COSAG02_NODE_1358_length_13076_cov_6.377745_1_plen_300_part_00